jgi:cellulose synthase/poly-beta-1,6-N-acetylglucosamine synthase-like glycosyltransferase
MSFAETSFLVSYTEELYTLFDNYSLYFHFQFYFGVVHLHVCMYVCMHSPAFLFAHIQKQRLGTMALAVFWLSMNLPNQHMLHSRRGVISSLMNISNHSTDMKSRVAENVSTPCIKTYQEYEEI